MDLAYGETYEACVRALYACGLSDPICYRWTSSYLHPPRDLDDEYIYGTNEVPLMWLPPMTGTIPMAAAAFKVVYVGPQLQAVGPHADAAAEVTIIEYDNVDNTRVMGDLQFSFPNAVVSEAGSESDGEFIYTAVWNSGDYLKYDLAGNLIETFQIPGTNGCRDLAYDGTFMYGAAAATTVWVMDFTTKTLVTTFTAPTAVRAIGYNHNTMSFYGNNWGTDIVNFDASGANLGSFTPTVTSIYGLAYDSWSGAVGEEFLWAYDQGANNLVQYALPGGTPTGTTIDVAGITGNTSIAGGAWTQPALFDPGFVTIGGCSQGGLVWGLELAPYSGGGPTPGGIPDGLSSFNVYQDGVMIANVPYEGQDVDEFVTYVVNPLDPATYLFDVSAVYDLTIFGFPGDFGESAWEGTDTVEVVWGNELPFFEGWDQGTFAFQGWSFNENAANWVVNSQIGDPEPSAEFTWDPLLELDYTSALTSNPITADLLTEGDIFFDFDIALDDRNSTGEEMLKVEVYNGSSWNTVATFTNDGSFDFMTSHVNITNHAMSRVFKVRFNATGQNSFDIVSWFVDNINIYRECMAPTDLVGEYVWTSGDELGAEICWEGYVAPSNSQWFYYDDETIEYVWGSTGDWDADVAIKIETADLVDFAGAAVTQYRAFVDSRLMGVGTISVKVFQGDNPDPTAPIYEEDVTSQFVIGDDWNDFTFSQAVMIDINQPLWMGMYYTGPANTYGPGITTDMGSYDPNGDLFYDAGSWIHLQSQGISNRAWLLRGFVTTSYGSTVAIGNTNINPLPVSTGLTTAGTLVSTDASLSTLEVSSVRTTTNFNVYRMNDVGVYELLAVVPSESGVSSYCYYDTEVGFPMEYCYQVTAAYESATDACESAPAMAYELPMNDFVCVFITGIDNPNDATTTNVYPNPAQDMVTVSSSVAMTQLTVTNYVGQVVYTSKVHATSVELNTSSYQAGVYLVKINTENGVVTKRVIISR